ncbi:MAG: hypothetical protein ABIA04_08485 [Pseudomonadota bacterium]
MNKEEEIISEIKESKKAVKNYLINLSFSEKIKRIVEMQKLSAKLKKGSKNKIYIWNI